jgi:hypothetical protein
VNVALANTAGETFVSRENNGVWSEPKIYSPERSEQGGVVFWRARITAEAEFYISYAVGQQ